MSALIICLVFCGMSAGATLEVVINGSSDVSGTEIRRAATDGESDSIAVAVVLRLLNERGYPEAAVSLRKGTSADTLEVTPGARYKIRKIRIVGELAPECGDILDGIEFRQMYADSNSVRTIAETVISEMSNAGYPFAQVSLDDVAVGNSAAVDLALRVISGPLVRFDTSTIAGADPRTARHLASVMPVRAGDEFSDSKIDESIQLLETCNYLSVADSALLRFSHDNTVCTPVFSVRQLAASLFEGLVGYQPGKSGRPGYVKGSVRAEFENLFGNGLSLSMFYNKKDQASHDISLAGRQRFLFGRQIAVSASVRQLKYEDMYQSLQADGQIEQGSGVPVAVRLTGGWSRYTPIGTGFRGVYHSRKWTWGLGTTILLSSGKITQKVALDVSYGLKRQYEFSGAVPEPARVDETRLLGKYTMETTVGRRFGGKVTLSGAALKTDESIVPPTDLFRLGGARSLRGYREDQFLCKRYAMATIQPELTLMSGALVRVFAEAAWLRDSSGDLFREGTGFGLGFTLPTGSLSTDVAWGRHDTFGEGKLYVILESRF